MKKYSPQFWAAVKADYCSGARSVAEISAYYSVGEGAVYAHRKAENWERSTHGLPAIPITLPEEGESSDAEDRSRLTARLKRLLTRTVAEIELAAATTPDKLTSMDRARDVRTLATVVRLIDTLDHPPAAPGAAVPQEESEQNDDLLRQEIADRLGRLRDAGRTA